MHARGERKGEKRVEGEKEKERKDIEKREKTRGEEREKERARKEREGKKEERGRREKKRTKKNKNNKKTGLDSMRMRKASSMKRNAKSRAFVAVLGRFRVGSRSRSEGRIGEGGMKHGRGGWGQ